MSDWRAITSHTFEDGYGYELFHDPEYDADWYERGFKIYATTGAGRYIPVDVSISSDTSDEENHAQNMLADAKAYLPLYLFAHSGVRVSTEPFNDPWDSGQCGFAVLEKDSDVDGDQAHLENVLELMVREFDHLLRGNVVGWRITKQKVCDSCKNIETDVIDSCTGYIGFDFKEMDQLADEVIDNINKHREAEHASRATAIGND